MKKVLSLTLCFIMVLCAIPTVAFALNIGAETQKLSSDLNEKLSKAYHPYIPWDRFGIDKDNQYDSSKVKIVNNVVYYLDKDRYVCVSLIDSEKSAEKKEITIVDKIDNIPVTQIMDIQLFDVKLKVEKITLPDTIEEITEETFYYCNELKTINLPDSIKRIGMYAFCRTKISSLTVPKNLESTIYVSGGATGENNKYGWCFAGMPSLVSVTVPDTIKQIPEGMFSSCKKLSKVTLGSNLTTIGNCAFRYCKALKSIKFPKSLKLIDELAFSHSGLNKVNIPKSCNTINYGAFIDCKSLEKVTFNGICSLRGAMDEGNYYSNVFTHCKKLKTVKGSKYIVSITDNTFYGCKSLTSLTLSKNLKEIGRGVFSKCRSLKKLKILTKKAEIFNNKDNFKGVPKTCKAYVKTKAVKEAIINSGFKGRVIVNKNLK